MGGVSPWAWAAGGGVVGDLGTAYMTGSSALSTQPLLVGALGAAAAGGIAYAMQPGTPSAGAATGSTRLVGDQVGSSEPTTRASLLPVGEPGAPVAGATGAHNHDTLRGKPEAPVDGQAETITNPLHAASGAASLPPVDGQAETIPNPLHAASGAVSLPHVVDQHHSAAEPNPATQRWMESESMQRADLFRPPK